jgi:hypothetical protein
MACDRYETLAWSIGLGRSRSLDRVAARAARHKMRRTKEREITMIRKYVSGLGAITLALAVPIAAHGHHGWSSYDADKVLKITAPLADLSWSNPHATAKVAYQGRTWDVILAPVSRMTARGLTEAMIAPGKTITLEGYPRSDGTAEMRIERVTAQGKVVELR